MNELPFNNATIGGTTVSTSDFVHGSGTLTENGQDVATTTADGRIHNDRQAVNIQAEMELYGDKTTLNSDVGLSEAIVLKQDSDTVKSVNGIVTATYNKQSRTTRVSIQGDPVTT